MTEKSVKRRALLTGPQAAAYLGMSRAWLDRHHDEIPHLQMGGERRYEREALDAYLEKARRGPELTEASA